MDYKPNRVTWRGQQFDSQLEADWAATFTVWGMEYEYHPGWMALENSDIFEPDFLLEDDIVFEVKGAHNHRLDKAHRAESEFGLKVIIGRTGWMPAGSDTEYAGAVWEPENWCLVNNGSKLKFVKDWEPDMGSETVQVPSFSAMFAFARGFDGIRMFKAVGEEDIK